MSLDIERLDHLGIVAGIIKDLGIVNMVNDKLGTNSQEEISSGEAVAAMILNGLGFTSKPLSLTPNFFQHKPLELLFREGVKAEHFNRSKLGRVLDEIFNYGCSNLFYEISAACCIKENIDLSFNSLDTTTLSLYGEYDSLCDEQAIKIKHGYSKDYRDDLKQVVHELLVSQDGGVPLFMQSWDGNASDSTIFKERCSELIKLFEKSEAPRYLIADSKLYNEKNSENLSKLNYITRIPRANKEEKKTTIKAFKLNDWLALDNSNKYKSFAINHNNIPQRWIVINSDAARNRAEKTVGSLVETENKLIKDFNKQSKKNHLSCKTDAENKAKAFCTKLKYHLYCINICEIEIRNNESIDTKYYLAIDYRKNIGVINTNIDLKSCYTLGTNIDKSNLSDEEIIKAYKRQNSSIENMGFRFLKDPIFFTSSLFLKKSSRIEGLLTIMTLSLLIYSIAQRRARNILEASDETVPNQINKPIKKPTARWLFQLMDGINAVKIEIGTSIYNVIQGLTDLKKKIVDLFGENVSKIYRAYASEIKLLHDG